MPINFDISQVITAITNLKNAIEKPGPLLDGLGDLMVEKLQQTTPEGVYKGGTLRKAMSKKGKPHRRGRKWTIGIGDPDALGTPGTMQSGTGSDKGLIAAFLKVYRDQRREEQKENAQRKQEEITTKGSARNAKYEDWTREDIVKARIKIISRSKSVRVGRTQKRKWKSQLRNVKPGIVKQENIARKLSRPLTKLESRIRVTAKNIGVRNELIAAREKYKSLVSRGLEEGWTDKKFIGEFRSHYKYIKTLTARTSGKIKGGVALEALDVEQVGFYTSKAETRKTGKQNKPTVKQPKPVSTAKFDEYMKLLNTMSDMGKSKSIDIRRAQRRKFITPQSSEIMRRIINEAKEEAGSEFHRLIRNHPMFRAKQEEGSEYDRFIRNHPMFRPWRK